MRSLERSFDDGTNRSSTSMTVTALQSICLRARARKKNSRRGAAGHREHGSTALFDSRIEPVRNRFGQGRAKKP